MPRGADRWRDSAESAARVAPVLRLRTERLADGSVAKGFALRESADVVVAIGGREGGSASQLLAIARDQYPIIPLAGLGGTGRQEFIRQEAWLRARIQRQQLVDELQSEGAVDRIDELIRSIRHAHGRRRIFLSYPWSRAEDADFVAAFLRRSPHITLFRDEVDIYTGESISHKVRSWIDTADVFLALWCREYAASPHCHDELHRAVHRRDCLLYVLRLDDTRPVWPSLRVKGDWMTSGSRRFQTSRWPVRAQRSGSGTDARRWRPACRTFSGSWTD